jgi:hypothetical protein
LEGQQRPRHEDETIRRPTFAWSTLLTLALTALPMESGAGGSQFTIEPANPTTTDNLHIRWDTGTVCTDTTTWVELDLSSHVVDVWFYSGDTCNLGNPAHTAPVRYIPVGALPAAFYEFRYHGCGFGPEGNTCVVFHTAALVVLGVSDGTPTIPTMSWAGLAAMLGMILVAGLAAFRFR